MLKIAIVLKGKQRKRKMIMNPFIFDKILQKNETHGGNSYKE